MGNTEWTDEQRVWIKLRRKRGERPVHIRLFGLAGGDQTADGSAGDGTGRIDFARYFGGSSGAGRSRRCRKFRWGRR